MNAYELADKVDLEPYGIYGEQAANMLRKQADRIAELEGTSAKEDKRLKDLYASQLKFTTPQIKELSDEEIKLIKGVVSDYVCTLKMEIDQQKQAFKGYEHCSNLDGLNNELKDSEQALAILKKASEK